MATDCSKVKGLDNVMKKSVLKEPITVYHGMGETEGAMFGNKGIGSSFSNDSFLSTSTNKDTGENYAAYSGGKSRVLVIDLPAGSHGFAYGDKGYESEVLLPRGSNFTITSIDDSGSTEYIHVTPS